jgi:hypothetical protein
LGHLLCRFDFRLKTWALAVVHFRRDSDSLFPANSAALAFVLSQKISDFSDPTMGGAKPSKTSTNELKSGHNLSRSSTKTKQQIKEE